MIEVDDWLVDVFLFFGSGLCDYRVVLSYQIAEVVADCYEGDFFVRHPFGEVQRE